MTEGFLSKAREKKQKDILKMMVWKIIFLSRQWLISRFHVNLPGCTPPKFNMEPEKKSPEKEVPLGNHHFQVPC